MKNTLTVRLVLIIAGALTGIIGVGILLVPDAFYATYQVTVPDSPSLRSELKSMGTLLFLAGSLMLAGAVKESLQATAVIVASGTYTALVLGRLLGLVVDGMPSPGILAAWAVEAVLLLLIVIASIVARTQPATPPLR